MSWFNFFRSITPDSDWSCAICLDNTRSLPIQALVCNHLFHEECIKAWKERSATCPTCRQIDPERAVVITKRPALENLMCEMATHAIQGVFGMAMIITVVCMIADLSQPQRL